MSILLSQAIIAAATDSELLRTVEVSIQNWQHFKTVIHYFVWHYHALVKQISFSLNIMSTSKQQLKVETNKIVQFWNVNSSIQEIKF